MFTGSMNNGVIRRPHRRVSICKRPQIPVFLHRERGVGISAGQTKGPRSRRGRVSTGVVDHLLADAQTGGMLRRPDGLATYYHAQHQKRGPGTRRGTRGFKYSRIGRWPCSGPPAIRLRLSGRAEQAGRAFGRRRTGPMPACRRRSSIFRLLNPMAVSSPNRRSPVRRIRSEMLLFVLPVTSIASTA
jgi:hypothetical protein